MKLNNSNNAGEHGHGVELDKKSCSPKPNDKMLPRDIVKHFASGTSMHGIPKVIQSRSPKARIFWFLLWLVAMVIFCVHLALLISKYCARPTKVSLEIAPASMPFPDISICNSRNLHVTVLNELNRILKENSEPFINSTYHGGDPFIEAYLETIAKFYPLFMRSDTEMKVFQKVLTRSMIATNIERDLVVGAGISIHEFIASCRLGGRNCNKSTDFTSFFDPYFYNCYTYHAPIDRGDGYFAEGIENGWSTVVLSGNGMLEENTKLRMIPGTHEWLSPMSSSAGVRVVIHPPNTRPYPHTEGFDIPPGFSVSLGVKARQNLRLGPPYGTCSNDPSGTGEVQYRQISCQKKCLQRAVVDTCGCKDIHLPGYDNFADVKFCTDVRDVPNHCNISGTDECLRKFLNVNERISCVQEVLMDITTNKTSLQSCNCPLACQELKYDASYSLSKWPAGSFDGDEAYIDIFETGRYPANILAIKDAEMHKLFAEYFSVENRRMAMRDFARLNVYVAENSVLNIVESEGYSLNELLSDIGGHLALWVGISVITIAEVLELLMTICYTMKNRPSTNPVQ